MSGRWLRHWGLVLGSLALLAPALAQQPAPAPLPAALTHRVRLTPGRRPLGAVLAELAHQSRLPLSYSSSLVPLGHRYQVRSGPPRPLGEVLGEVLAAEHLAYGLLDGQLVLWPGSVAPPPGITFLNGHAPTAPLAAPGASASTGQSTAGVTTRQVGAAARPPFNAPTRSVSQGLIGQSATKVGASPAGNLGAVKPTPQHASTPLAAQPASANRATQPSSGAPGLAYRRPSVEEPSQKQAVASRRAATRPATASVTLAQKQVVAGRSPGKRVPAARAVPAPLFGAAASLPATGAAGALARPRLGSQQLLPASSSLVPLVPSPAGLALPASFPLPATLAAVSLPTRRPVETPPPTTPAPRLRGLYLHAEAWAGESLLLGATGKLGVPRAYLVLGAALADNGRQSGPALGLGLGTTGRARGRFTPSLEVLAWRVGAGRDREEAPLLLTQLRPQLSWQVRRNGRLALVAGPTLNLATAHQRSPQLQPARWDFGRDQWLWAEKTDDESLLRLWPGVQLGVRF